MEAPSGPHYNRVRRVGSKYKLREATPMPKIAATLLTCAACYGLFAADLRGAEPRPAAGKADDSRPGAGKADDSRPGAGKADDSRPGAGKQVPAKLDAQVHVSLNYLLYLPPGY